MTTPEGPPEGPEFQINVPEPLESGVYANGASVWHTAYEFTLDFVTLQPVDPESPNVVPCRVVSRVKIPPTVIFDLLQALNGNMTRYEARFGEIKRIEPIEPEEEA